MMPFHIALRRHRNRFSSRQFPDAAPEALQPAHRTGVIGAICRLRARRRSSPGRKRLRPVAQHPNAGRLWLNARTRSDTANRCSVDGSYADDALIRLGRRHYRRRDERDESYMSISASRSPRSAPQVRNRSGAAAAGWRRRLAVSPLNKILLVELLLRPCGTPRQRHRRPHAPRRRVSRGKAGRGERAAMRGPKRSPPHY